MKRSETDEIFSKRDFPSQEERKKFVIKVCILVESLLLIFIGLFI